MHLYTHTKPESLGQAGPDQSPYHDTMIDHDKYVGEMLDFLDELVIAEETFVKYATDNGPHMNTWPDAAMTPFRSENNTNWEGASRIPQLVRWPGKIPAGVISNEITQLHDWLPTFMAIAGDADIPKKFLTGNEADGQTFKVHIDGYNLLPFLTGEEQESPRKGLIYFNDDGDRVAVRFGNWKILFEEQRVEGTLRAWAEPFTKLRMVKVFNLRTDPFERADITSNTFYEWQLRHAPQVYAATFIVQEFVKTFKDFPPRQKAASFTIERRVRRCSNPRLDSARPWPGSGDLGHAADRNGLTRRPRSWGCVSVHSPFAGGCGLIWRAGRLGGQPDCRGE